MKKRARKENLNYLIFLIGFTILTFCLLMLVSKSDAALAAAKYVCADADATYSSVSGTASATSSLGSCGSVGPTNPIAPEVGWPVTVPGKVNTAAVIANLDADADLEIAYGVEDESSTNHGIYIFEKNGTGTPVRRLATTYRVRSSPAVADVDNDGDMDIVAADRAATGKVYVWDAATGTLLPSSACSPNPSCWPKTLPAGNIVTTSPIAVNLDDDPQLEIVVATWGNKIFAWNHDGTPLISGNTPAGKFVDGTDPFYASPAAGDLDRDGKIEIIAIDNSNSVWAWKRDGTGFLNAGGAFSGAGELAAAMSPSEPASSAASAMTLDNPRSSPAVADIDGDGRMEVIVATHKPAGANPEENKVYAFHSIDANSDTFADNVLGWPKDLDSKVTSSVAVANIDKKEGLEIVVATEGGFLYAFHNDGTAVFSPVAVGSNSKVDSSPILTDVDADGDIEIVVGAYDGKLYAYHHIGTLVTNWPIDTQPLVTDPNLRLPISFATPAVADFDNDGRTEIVVGADTMSIYAWDLAKTYNAKNVAWGKFRKDLANSGAYLRNVLFSEEFNGPIDLAKWSTNLYPTLSVSGGKAVIDGDGTREHAVGLGIKKRFARNQNLTFIFDGFSFEQKASNLNLLIGAGGFRDPNGRMLVLTNGYCDPTNLPACAFRLWDSGVAGFLPLTTANVPAFQENTNYSLMYRFLGDPAEVNHVVEVYLYETAKGRGSVGGPIYTWSFMNMDPGLGISIYPGWGRSYVDSVVVYGPEDANLDRRAPQVTGIGNLQPSYTPGQLVSLQAQGTFTPGTQEPSPCYNLYGNTGFSWAMHFIPNPTYGGYWSGSFSWQIPPTQPPGVYQFSTTMYGCSGISDSMLFSVNVTNAAPAAPAAPTGTSSKTVVVAE